MREEGWGTSTYAEPAPGTPALSIAGLRHGSLKFWFVGIGALSLAVLYVNPLVVALREPALASPLPTLHTPALRFPTLAVPKLKTPAPVKAVPAAAPVSTPVAAAPVGRQAAAPAAASLAPAATAATPARPQAATAVPVVTSQYTSVPAPAATKEQAAPVDPFAQAEVVDDTVGALPGTALSGTLSSAEPTSAAVVAAPAVEPVPIAEPMPVAEPAPVDPMPLDPMLETAPRGASAEPAPAELSTEVSNEGALPEVPAVAEPAPAEPAPAAAPETISAPAPAPIVAAAPLVAPDPAPAPPIAPEVVAPPTAPPPVEAPAPTPVPELVAPVVSTPPAATPSGSSEAGSSEAGSSEASAPSVPPVSAPTPPAAPAGIDAGTPGTTPTPPPTDGTISSTPPAGTSSGGASGAGTSGGGTTTQVEAAPAGAPPVSAETPPTDPAAVPGSGPSPPAAWLETISTAGSHAISVVLSGSELQLTIDGVTSIRARDGVTSLSIVGSNGDDTFSVSSTGGFSFSLNGGSGTDTLLGPAANSTWLVTGSGSGSVGSLSFSGFENLTGAAGNDDTFVFDSAGGLSGTVEGGYGGYDSVELTGAASAAVVATITGAQSGTISRDGNRIVYAGMEPITISPTGSFTLDATAAGSNAIDIQDFGTGSDGQIQIVITIGEDHVISIGALTELVINASAGDDTISLHALDTGFSATITVNGGAGNDTFVAPDVEGAFKLTGIGAGSYDPSVGPTVTFTGIESLTGAATAADSFEFESGAGIEGAIVDGAGSLTVSIAGWLKVTGDYDFVRETRTVIHSGSGTPINVSVLKLAGTTGTLFVGVEPFDSPLGIGGTIQEFGLAIVTSATQAWHLAKGTVTSPSFIGFGTDFTLSPRPVTISVATKADDDTYLSLGGGQAIAAGTVSLDFASDGIFASASISLSIGDFVHISGNLTFGFGGTVAVDVATGLPANSTGVVQTALSSITSTTADCSGSGLSRTADFTRICNLQVSQFTIAASAVSIFVGYNPGQNAGADGILQRSELSADAAGVWVENVNIGLALLSAKKTGLIPLDLLGLKFHALSATAASFELLGIPEVTVSSSAMEVRVNGGKPWLGLPLNPTPVVDFAASFPGGYTVQAGPSPSIAIDYDGNPVIGASADNVLFKISDFVYVSGSFSFNKGAVEYVDVRTNLPTLSSTQLDLLFGPSSAVPISATDPGGQTLGRTADGSWIWNLPVDTFEIGLGGVDVFVGYSEDLDAYVGGADGDLTLLELQAANAIGVFLDEIDLGLVSMTARTVTGAPGLNLAKLKFMGLNVTAGTVAIVGIPEVTIQASNVQVRVNRGSFIPLAWPAALGGPAPIVDFAASYPDNTYAPNDADTLADGYRVQTSTSGNYVTVGWSDQVVGASVDNALLRVSDFVYISGSFSFNKGLTAHVDIRTNLTGLTSGQATALFGTIAVNDTDPGGTTLARTTSGDYLWNLPVEIFEIGAGGVDIFVGYSEGLEPVIGDGQLTKQDLLDRHAIGLFLENTSFGLVSMRALNVATGPLATLNAALLKFMALQVDASTVALLGIPELDLEANNLQVRVNRGSYIPGAWPALPIQPPPVVDFAASYPDNAYSPNDADTLVDGYRVQTSTSGSFQAIKHSNSGIGASADRVLFKVSDFVYVSGGFSFNKGAVQYVDVKTNLTGTIPPTLFGSITQSATDPGGQTLARTPDGSMIWNLPVQTLDIGFNGVDIFVGYSDDLDSVVTDGDLTLLELQSKNAVGLFLDNVSAGIVVMNALPIPAVLPIPATLNAAFLKFFALQVDAVTVAIVGIPELTIQTNNLQVRVNRGSFVPGAWPSLPIQPPPIVDFQQSFPDNTYAPNDGDTLPDGYRVQTNTSGAFVAIRYTQPVIGASADRVLLKVSDFVYVSGGFSFNKGAVNYVDVRTGLTALTDVTAAGLFGLPLAGGLAISDTDPGGTALARSSAGDWIWNLPVETIDFGLTNVDVFLGYSENLFSYVGDGELTLAELGLANAIGLFLDEVSLGMVSMRALPVTPGTGTLDLARLSFLGLKVNAGNVALLGVPELTLSASNLEVRVNRGTFVPGAWPGLPTGAPPVVDFAVSFPDNFYVEPTPDIDLLADGYRVATDTSGSFVALKWTQPLVGASADNVLLKVSDFVYISGGFSFNKGPVQNVDIRTGLNLDAVSALALYGSAIPISETDPVAGTLARNGDGSMIWNLPVQTLEFGLNEVDVFLGYSENLSIYTGDGELTLIELGLAKAIGVFLDEVTVGLAIFDALPVPLGVPSPGTLNGANLKFMALKANAANIGLVGVPEIQLSATNAEVRVNRGSFAGAWPAIPGVSPPPVIDFDLSFPDGHYLPDDGNTAPDGYRVATNTSGAYVDLHYTTPVIGASADNILLRISDFVYVTGGFSFNKGQTLAVDIRTGLTPLAGVGLGTIARSDTDPGSTLAAKNDSSIIWNLPVQTLEFGMTNVDVFVGYASGLATLTSDGELTKAELESIGAIGVYLDEVELGLLLADALPTSALNGILDPAKLRFFSLMGSAANLGLTGIPAVQLEATNARVTVNNGRFAGSWPVLPGGPPPVIDYKLSFPDNTYTPNDSDTTADGYRVPTNTSGSYVALTFDSPLIGGGAENVTIQISEFVYLTGSIYFEKGRTANVSLTTLAGTVDDLLDPFPTPIADALRPYLGSKQVSFMTIGASNVYAFVGLDGPVWTDDNGDGLLEFSEIDDNGNGTIDANERNPESIGLVIEDLDFALVIATPTIAADPSRYVALRASADNLAFVGIDGLTATAQDLLIEINLSSPSIGGLPILPVINWAASFPGEAAGTDPDSDGRIGEQAGFQLETGGAPVYIDFSTPLIRAKTSYIELDLFGVVTVSGSVAFVLGPQETVTLSNGSVRTVTTMTIGAANVTAFVGANGPYWRDTDRDGNVDSSELNSSSIGVHITDLDLGVFVGADVLGGGAYVAVKLDVYSFGLVNIPGVTLTGTLSVELNLGASLTNGGAAIDFLTSFPDDPLVVGDEAGFEVDTGNPAFPVLLDFDDFLINVEAIGTLSVAGVLNFLGVFVLQADSTSLKVLAAVSLEIGPDMGGGANLLDISALGVLILDGTGLAADLDVDFNLGDTSSIGFAVSARVLVNTTGQTKSITVSDRFYDVLQESVATGNTLAATLSGRLGLCGGARCYSIDGRAPNIFTSTTAPDLANVDRLLNGAGAGLTFVSTAGSYVVVAISGEFNFLGFATGTGLAAVKVQSGSFEMLFDLELRVGVSASVGLNFEADGLIGIYTDGIYVDVNVSLDVNLLSLFDLDLDGSLQIDTRGSTNYFRLALSGNLSVLRVITVSGSVIITVNNNAWSILVPQSNPLSASFGPFNITAYGEIRSTGYFDINFSGGVTLGTSDTNINGSVFVNASFNPANGRFALTVGGSFGAKFLGVNLLSVTASANVVGFLGQSVDVYVTVTGTGAFIETILEIVRMTANAAADAGYAIYNFLGSLGCEISSWFGGSCDEWVDVQRPKDIIVIKSPSFTLYLVSFRLPSSLVNQVPPPANLATKSGSTLTLNVGTRGNLRTVGVGMAAESYTVSDLGASTGGGRRIRVVAFGEVEAFDGITKIDGSFGTGDDTFIGNGGVTIPVEIYGGAGNDTLQYNGSSWAKLYGEGDHDSLSLGGAANGNLTNLILDGGSGNDTLVSDSADPTTLQGGSENDSLRGGTANDVLDGGSGNDLLEGRGGLDSVTGGEGDDVLTELLTNLVSGETFSAGNQVTAAGDRVAILGTNGADDVRVTRSGSNLVITEYSGGVAVGSLTVTGLEELTIDVREGANAILLDGELNLAGLKLVTIDLDQAAGADDVVVKLTNGDDGVSLVTAPAVGGSAAKTGVTWAAHHRIGITGSSASNDVLRIEGLNGNDRLSGAGVLHVLWDTVDLIGGEGNDILIGTPDDDVLDSGNGNDMVSGLGGTDTFVDPSGTDVLIEIALTGLGLHDFGIYGDLFVTGVATITTIGSYRTVTAFGSAIIESPAAFEAIVLTGTSLNEANIFTLGSGNGTVTVNGVLRTVTPRGNFVEFNGVGGNDTYFLELAGMNGVTVEVLETDEDIRFGDYNGDGDTLDPSEDVNGNGVLNAGEDLDGDGILDPAERFFILAGGTDSLTINGTNSADTGRAIFFGPVTRGAPPLTTTVDATQITLENAASAPSFILLSARIEQHNVYLRGGNDTFALRSSAITLLVDGGDGDDTILLGSNANELTGANTGGTLDGIDLPVTVAGGANTDVLGVDDTDDASVNSGTLTSTAITGLGLHAAGIQYVGIETLGISLGSGADTFNVRSTFSGATTTVDTGSGSDTVNVSSNAGTNTGDLNGIAGGLVLRGGSAITVDVLNASDSGDSGIQAGTLTSNSLTGFGMTVGIDYSGFETFVLDLGSGADTLDVLSTHGGSSTINARDGPDTLDLAGISGIVSVNAGNGADDVSIRSTNAGSTLTVNGGVGADWIDVLALGGTVVVNGDSDDDTIEIGSAAANTVRSVDAGGNVDGVAGALTVNGGSATTGDRLYVDETGETDGLGNDGLLTSTRLTGLGLGSFVDYFTTEFLTIRLGTDGTRFDIRSTSVETRLETGGGADTINLSSDAPANSGTLNFFLGHLTVDGQGGSDTLNASDAGDGAANTGQLTSTDLTELGTAGVTYAGLEFLNIDLGSGGDTFTIVSTHSGQTTLDTAAGIDLVNVRTIFGHTLVDTGLGADTVRVGTLAPAVSGLLDGIGALLELEGGGASDQLFADDTGDGTPNTGTLTSDHLAGLGLATPIHYTGFELLTIGLGSGADTFTILSTHAGQTTLNAGAAIDTIDIESIAGTTQVNGEGGNDEITVNGDVSAPAEANGIGAVLTLDGGANDDHYVIWTFGNGDSRIVVADTGGGQNKLEIHGTPVADQFLLRHDLVALLNGGGTQVERIVYDNRITAGLFVHAGGGNDRFALDDNSAVTTINGDAGDDLFQVGQLWGVFTAADPVEAPVYRSTTRGQLTNGVSVRTTINGGADNDTFSIFSNVAELDLFGDDGDDTFIIRTFVLEDSTSNVDGGDGSDLVDYVANAPVNIDGGDGYDRLVVIGTEVGDVFLITAAGIYGAGRVVTYVAIEQVDLDGAEGRDLFVIHSTPVGTVTSIFGGLGSDSVLIGGDVPPRCDHTPGATNSYPCVDTGLQSPTLPATDHRTALLGGPVLVNGGIDVNSPRAFPSPVLLPGESASAPINPPNPTFDEIEDAQVDTLVVDNSGGSADESGTLTSSRITGLGTAGDLAFPGRPTIPGGISYAAFETLVIELGSARDSFLVESTHIGTTAIAGNGGDDSFTVRTTAGHTLLTGGAGDDTVSVGGSQLLDGISGLLAIDLGADNDSVSLDDSADANDNLGTLTQTSVTGLDMASPSSFDRFYSLTPGSAAFTITVGAFSATYAAGITAADLQTALQNLLFADSTSCGTAGLSSCSRSVFVWRVGGDLLIGFQGELRGALAPALSSTATDLLRVDGVNYYGLENLSIALGSGHDRFNVRGTLPVTALDTRGGDDLVYVSDAADLGAFPTAALASGGDLATLHDAILHGIVTVDDRTYFGSLDLIAGALWIQTGSGSNTLSVSDRADANADSAVTITDSSITGLAPAPIAYAAAGGDLAGQGHWARLADSGLFGRGVNVYGGTGGNAFTISSVLGSAPAAPFGASITTLYAGAGLDSVTISVAAGAGRILAVHGETGDDTIDGAPFALPVTGIPLVLFGDAGSDTLTGGSAADRLVGDDGRVIYLRPLGAPGFDIVLGGAPLAAGASADGDFLTTDALLTADPAIGGRDVINGGNGDDIVLGGAGGDEIRAGEGANIVLGDFGRLALANGLPILAVSTDPTLGGDDQIYSGSGDDLVVAGIGGDVVEAGEGTNLVIGDNGRLVFNGADGDPLTLDLAQTTAPEAGGGSDDITTGSGGDLILGGQGGDTINAGNGANYVLGDNGFFLFFGGLLDLAESTEAGSATEPALGGDDEIDTGSGRDVIVAGFGADDVQAGAGDNIVIGDSGRIDAIQGSGILARVETIAPSFGGIDELTTLGGDDILLGGSAGDILHAGEGTNLVLGDDGFVDYVLADGDASDIDRAESTDTWDGGDDEITTGAGGDLILGGFGADTIRAGEGRNIVFGDSGAIIAAVANLPRVGTLPLTIGRAESTSPTLGGADAITTGAGGDLIVGGIGSDVILAGGGDNRVIGDNGVVVFDGPDGDTATLDLAQTTAPEAGGGDDQITTGSGNDIVVGGDGADTIGAGGGDNYVVGDNGRILFFAAKLDLVESTEPAQGARDEITTGDGNDTIIGGFGGDLIAAGAGDNAVMGDNGRIDSIQGTGARILVETIATSIGGDDTIGTGSGNDTIFGGAGSDTITDAGGSNIVFGDNGFANYLSDGDPSDIDKIASTAPNDGAADTITIGGVGDNYVIGGTGGDTVTTGASNDLIFGDHAELVGNIPLIPLLPVGPAPFTYTSIFTQNSDVLAGADDTISAGAGRNVVFGGQGADSITALGGDDDLIGGHSVAGGQDAADRIDAGAGNDVVAGDNALVLRRGDSLSLRIRTLTGAQIYSIVSETVVANIGAASINPAGVAERTIVLFDHGSANGTLFGSDSLAGGAGHDVLFGQMGNDWIQGDGGVTLPAGTSAEDFAGAGADGDDYVEGGGGNDLILGGLGQDDLIGGSSSLYLAPGSTRPDGVDTIYGGAGTRIGIDDAGQTGATAQARDADVIAGDNASIYRLVGGGAYLSFAYDNYGALKLIPRAVTLLDYSPTGDAAYLATNPTSPSITTAAAGTGANIGGGDFLHGEGGDDTIHGQGGRDSIFGDGQDDSLYGGAGSDWISGGAGDDGILGDDGLLRVSRNGVAEPLYGIAASAQTVLTVNGDKQNLTVNFTGKLHYTADLEPFFVGANDIAYGGLGNDFLHGGVGDDALSGAEALAFYYDGGRNPLGVLAGLSAAYANGDPLGYNAATTLFRYYDANDPWRKIQVAPGVEFLLNFTAGTRPAVRDDGKDVLFGDTGNDWLVGGTNEDHLYGGYGDDLLQADDDLDSTAGTGDPRANNVPDPRTVAPTFADLAFGGAGRDVLIGNTSSDRLYDWAGEFNSYLVPFSPFGEQTITRAGSPSNRNFLYAASKADGADPTRGGDASRNGEPFGEIGLVTTGDADFGAQHGGPRDPQPGHQGNGRDTGSLGFSVPDPISATAAASPSTAAATLATVPTPAAPATVAVGPSSSDLGLVLPQFVNAATRASLAVTILAPTGATVNWSVFDGFTSLRGTAIVDAGDSVTVTIDVSALVDGALTLSVGATDAQGNVAEAASGTILKDTTGPSGSFTINGDSTVIGGIVATNSAFVALVLSFSDAGRPAQLEISIDGGLTWTIAADYVAAEAAELAGSDGVHVVAVRVTDAAGNSTVVTKQVRLDRSGPVVTMSGVTNGATFDLGQTIMVTFAATDATGIGTVSATLDGSRALSSGVGIATSTLAVGSHTIVVTATDQVGNATSVAVTFTIRVTTTGLSWAVSDGVSRKLINPSLQSSLQSKIQAAQSAIGRGDAVSARTMLQAFVNVVQGNAGQKIDAAYASSLVGWANGLLARV